MILFTEKIDKKSFRSSRPMGSESKLLKWNKFGKGSENKCSLLVQGKCVYDAEVRDPSQKTV